MSETKIEWTNRTWNPVRGCSRVSPGCINCYAERVAARFSGPGQPYHGLARMTPTGPHWTGDVRLVEEHLNDPLKWRKPRRIFVNSMSDLFHERLAFDDVLRVFNVMADAPQHTFQVLTKRPQRMIEYFAWFVDEMSTPYLPLANVWLGVSVENQKTADERIPLLLQTPAAVRFLSVEPLLGPVDLLRVGWPDKGEHRVDVLRGGYWSDGHGFVNHSDMPGYSDGMIGWVIVGGESGPGARPCDIESVRLIVEQCRDAEVPCFVKQLGAKPFMGVKGFGPLIRDRKGGDMSEWPADLRVREFPEAICR